MMVKLAIYSRRIDGGGGDGDGGGNGDYGDDNNSDVCGSG
jgi:hypothetical protein